MNKKKQEMFTESMLMSAFPSPGGTIVSKSNKKAKFAIPEKNYHIIKHSLKSNYSSF